LVQFDYNGKTGWVIASNVSVTGADTVLVAENIPQPPTAAPRPTARPRPRNPLRQRQRRHSPHPHLHLSASTH